MGWSRIIRQQESLVIYKSFKPLWAKVCQLKCFHASLISKLVISEPFENNVIHNDVAIIGIEKDTSLSK
jgi:hypothetical protein